MAIAWADANYTKRRVILLDSPSANLTNKDYLLKLKDAHAIANADMASRRYKITDWLGNVLSYEQEAYSEGASYVNLETWAKLPNTYASPSGDQNKVCVYYAYDGGADLDDAPNVWDASSQAVWHLGDLTDSTGNGHTLTASGASSGATGKVGDCYSFVAASSQYLERDATPPITATPFTLEGWFKPTTYHSGAILQISRTSSGDHWWNVRCTSSKGLAEVYGGGGASKYKYATTSNGYTTGSWHYCVHTSAATNDRTAILNADFANKGTETTDCGVTSVARSSIGRQGDSTPKNYFNGSLDEVRASSIVRSDAWLDATYHNISDADNAQTWGAEETAGTDYTQTINDSLGIADSAARIAAYTRAQSDPIGIADGASQVAAYAKALSESLGLTDDTSRVAAYARTPSESLGLTDDVITGAAYIKIIMDAVGLLDSLGATAAFARAISDEIGLSDDATRVLEIAREISDEIELSDATTKVSEIIREVADELGMTDIVVSDLVRGFLTAWYVAMRRNR